MTCLHDTGNAKPLYMSQLNIEGVGCLPTTSFFPISGSSVPSVLVTKRLSFPQTRSHSSQRHHPVSVNGFLMYFCSRPASLMWTKHRRIRFSPCLDSLDLLNYFCWIAIAKASIGNILHHNRTRSNKTILANMNSLYYRRPCSNP